MERAKVIFEQESSNCVQLHYPSEPIQHLVEYFIEISVPAQHPDHFSIIALPSLNTLISIPIIDRGKQCIPHSGTESYLVKGPKILGNLTQAITCSYPAGAKEFSIKFKPGLLQQLFAIKSAQLVNNQLNALDFLPSSLIATICEAPNLASRAALATTHLLALAKNPNNNKLDFVQKALALFASTEPSLKSAEIGQQIGLSLATLNRYFKEILGLSPKQCTKIVRFKTGLKYYRAQGSTVNFDGLGYTDFSHFAKDAKSLTKVGPSHL